MPYSYFEHVSDIGIQAEGPTLEEMFEAGAAAMLNVMFDLDTVSEAESVAVTAEAPEIDLLFVEVLNEVLSLQGRDELALKRLEAEEVRKTARGYAFTGTACGEKIDLERHGVRTEVKGATYSGLRYEPAGKTHSIRCILDV